MVAGRSIASLLGAREGLRLIRRPAELDDEVFFGLTDSSAEDARVVEGSELKMFAVANTGKSDFTHFMDGAQRARLAFYDHDMPGYVAFLNGAVLVRADVDMILSPQAYEAKLGVFAPSESTALGLLRASNEYDIHPVQCEPNRGMSGMAEDVRNEISATRDLLEVKLIRTWLESDTDGWLFVDGGIAQVCKRVGEFKRVVGVVKSHRKQYFSSTAPSKVVLGLDEGERTSVFEARTRHGDVSWSWYLRLRSDDGESPAFGLIRVEMPAAEETLNHVDTVSSWLMAERAPLSLPDARFDRLLYPIRFVEQFLRARHPSEATLSAMIGV